jgi:hypothetical protein
MTLMIATICLTLYVLAKLVTIYLIFWAVLLMTLALIMLGCAGGRQVVERKML